MVLVFAILYKVSVEHSVISQAVRVLALTVLAMVSVTQSWLNALVIKVGQGLVVMCLIVLAPQIATTAVNAAQPLILLSVSIVVDLGWDLTAILLVCTVCKLHQTLVSAIVIPVGLALVVIQNALMPVCIMLLLVCVSAITPWAIGVSSVMIQVVLVMEIWMESLVCVMARLAVVMVTAILLMLLALAILAGVALAVRHQIALATRIVATEDFATLPSLHPSVSAARPVGWALLAPTPVYTGVKCLWTPITVSAIQAGMALVAMLNVLAMVSMTMSVACVSVTTNLDTGERTVRILVVLVMALVFLVHSLQARVVCLVPTVCDSVKVVLAMVFAMTPIILAHAILVGWVLVARHRFAVAPLFALVVVFAIILFLRRSVKAVSKAGWVLVVRFLALMAPKSQWTLTFASVMLVGLDPAAMLPARVVVKL